MWCDSYTFKDDIPLIVMIGKPPLWGSWLGKDSFEESIDYGQQGLSQDLETGCLKLAIVKCLGVQIFKGDHNIV